jgi:superfamily II DNA or RNA helicase
VLFLVDRLELEDQARKTFVALLSADFQTVIYIENRDDWRRAEIVVTTVQSLLFNNKYQKIFSPADFDLVISDEAHRSIGGNARAVFDLLERLSGEFGAGELGLMAGTMAAIIAADEHRDENRSAPNALGDPGVLEARSTA